MPTITLSDGRKLTETGDQDSRGFQILRGQDGSLYTNQRGRIVLSRPAPGSSPVTSNIDTGEPVLDEFAQTLEAQLRQFMGSGNMSISDLIEITPEKVQEFVDQATRELDPFYQEQFKNYRQDFEEVTQELQVEHEANVEAITSRLSPTLRSFRDDLGERGLAQSGRRIRGESEIVDSAQRSIDSLQRGVKSTARQNIRATERAIGSRNLKDLAVPQFSSKSLGGFQAGETSLGNLKPASKDSPLFELSDDVTGRLEEERERDIKLRTSELKTAFRGQQARKLFNE